MGKHLALFVIFSILISEIECKVKVSFKLKDYENLSHNELDGGCCDLSCGSCDNRFNLCFDVYRGNSDMTVCAYGIYQTNRLFTNNDDFDFPSQLADNLANPIIFTINSWSSGFRSKIEVWDYDPANSDDKIDFYGYNYPIQPERSVDVANTHTITLSGAGTSSMRVEVKVYCAQHHYGTSCNTYCLARDDTAGHYDCNDFTGDKICHAGWTGTNCNVDINECSPNPCLNGARCTNLLADFRCDCPAGTAEKTCVNIDECSSDPCQNGGTCTDFLNYFVCTCQSDFSGKRCQFEIDHCDPPPCLNGGTCLGLDDDTGQVECTCAPGFTSATCNVDIDDCIGVDCMNGGLCVDLVNGFMCNCSDGFGGVHCEMNIRNECASDPCQNNASCVDEIDGYVCVCKPGFANDQCEENINECDTDPCVYGNCTDKINTYKCDCFDGYMGVNCSEEIDDCVNNLCENNSTCQDGFMNYTCECMPGYSGEYCQTDIDECAVSPCQHGGRCDQSQRINNFTCDCESTNYKGALCENDENECEFEEPVCRDDQTCVNEEGSYRCEELSSTPIPGLCVCYNDGTCVHVDNMFKCNCPSDFTGELCETPTELCTPNPCVNGGFCRVNTMENGTVFFECRCEDRYSGSICQILDPGRIVGGNERNTFQYWYILIVIILVIGIVAIGFFIYRRRKEKSIDNEGTVYANPYTGSVVMSPIGGATAAPPLPPKELDKLGEPIPLAYENNHYSSIDELQGREGCALPAPPPPYSLADSEQESPYAFGGYIPMGNGHAVSPRDDSQYESARDQTRNQNEYTVDPTRNDSITPPVGIDNGYSTRIEKGEPTESAAAPTRNNYSTRILIDKRPESSLTPPLPIRRSQQLPPSGFIYQSPPSLTKAAPSEDIPDVNNGIDNGYSTRIEKGEPSESAAVPTHNNYSTKILKDNRPESTFAPPLPNRRDLQQPPSDFIYQSPPSLTKAAPSEDIPDVNNIQNSGPSSPFDLESPYTPISTENEIESVNL